MCEHDKHIKRVIDVAKKSDQETKVGSLLVMNDCEVGIGYNRPLTDKPIYDTGMIIHAEADAISNFNSFGDLLGSTLYVAGKFPCINCAMLIVNTGITKVVCPPLDTNSRWVKSNALAMELFKEHDVEVITDIRLAGIEEGLTCPTKYSLT